MKALTAYPSTAAELDLQSPQVPSGSVGHLFWGIFGASSGPTAWISLAVGKEAMFHSWLAFCAITSCYWLIGKCQPH